MANLEIKLTLDGSNEEMAAVTATILNSISESKVNVETSKSDDLEKKIIEKEKAAKAEEAKARKAAEAKAKKEAEAQAAMDKATEEIEEDVKAEQEESSDEDGPTVSIEQIKSLMAKKISDHRDTIKKQMTKIGAQNVSTIPVDKYDSFHAFLEKLD